MSAKEGPIPHSEILQLKRWNTPTIYNGWEQLTKMDITDGFAQPYNIEPTTDYMPHMGPMCAYAFGANVRAKFGREGEH